MEKIQITDVWFEYNEANEEIYIYIKFKGRDIPYVTATISVEGEAYNYQKWTELSQEIVEELGYELVEPYVKPMLAQAFSFVLFLIDGA